MNYFEMFGLPVQYAVDESALTLLYLKKQREAKELSPQLNIAYASLKDPLLRAEYILSLQGKNVDAMPRDLAEKMFRLREEFSEIPDKDEFIKTQNEAVDNLLNSLKNYSADDPKFSEIFCEAKFIHSFLEKVQNAYSRD